MTWWRVRFALGCLMCAGCSAWIDADSYRGGGDAGGRDSGAPDVSVDAGASDVLLPDVMEPRDGGRDAKEEPDAEVRDAAMADAGRRDGGPDTGPCTLGPDTDGDGVIDACDRCEGFPDHRDEDGDGVPDGCDRWPCGVRPTIPSRVESEFITIDTVRIQGALNTAVVRFGERFRMSFNWEIDDTMCSTCTDRIEIGFTRVGRLDCVYTGNPPEGGETGRADIDNIPVPDGSDGVYFLRFNLGRDAGCPLGGEWYEGEPGANQTIGAVCVVN